MHNNTWRSGNTNKIRGRGNFRANNTFQRGRTTNQEMDSDFDINSRLGNSVKNYTDEKLSLSDGEQHHKRNDDYNNYRKLRSIGFSRGRGNSFRGSFNPRQFEREPTKPRILQRNGNSPVTVKVKNVPIGSPEDLVQFLQRKSQSMFTPKLIRPNPEKKEIEIELLDPMEAECILSLSGIRCGGEKLIMTVEENEMEEMPIDNTGTENRYQPRNKLNKFTNAITKAVESKYIESVQYLDLSNFRNNDALQRDKILVKSRNWYTIMEHVTNKLNKVQSINLENNNLKSLHYLQNLKLEQEINLSLENNLIEDIAELNKLNHLKIKELILNNNPIKVNAIGFGGEEYYRSELIRIFPYLQRLDNLSTTSNQTSNSRFSQQTLPFSSTNSQPQHNAPTNMPSIINNIGAFVNQFIEHYFKLYDLSRAQLSDFYNEKSTFAYESNNNQSNNVLGEQIQNRIQVEGLSIIQTLLKLPQTKHDNPVNYTVDYSLTETNTEVTMVLVTVHGKCQLSSNSSDANQSVLQCGFSRVFNIAINNIHPEQFIILNEMLTIHNESNKEEAERHNMIIKMQNDTGLNYQFAAKCLDDNSWNYTQAYYIFDQLKKQGMVPDNAFEIIKN